MIVVILVTLLASNVLWWAGWFAGRAIARRKFYRKLNLNRLYGKIGDDVMSPYPVSMRSSGAYGYSSCCNAPVTPACDGGASWCCKCGNRLPTGREEDT